MDQTTSTAGGEGAKVGVHLFTTIYGLHMVTFHWVGVGGAGNGKPGPIYIYIHIYKYIFVNISMYIYMYIPLLFTHMCNDSCQHD